MTAATAAPLATSPAPVMPFLFAVGDDGVRARRPADTFEAVVTALVVLVAAWVHSRNGRLREATPLLDHPPEWFTTFGSGLQITIVALTVMVVAAIVVRSMTYRNLARDVAVAILASAALTIVLARWTTDRWPQPLSGFAGTRSPSVYPLADLVFVTTVLAVAGPYLTEPIRRVGRVAIVTLALASIALGDGTVSSTVGAVFLGLAVSATIHVVFGSSTGIPGIGRVSSALQANAVPVTDLAYVDRQPVGATLLSGVRGDQPVLVKVYGRDAADAALAGRLWRRMWYRQFERAPEVSATRLQLVEHEALLLLDCERQGADVPRLVAWGRGDAGDAFVVTALPRYSTLRAVAAATVDSSADDRPRNGELDAVPRLGHDTVIDRCWFALSQLHEAGFVHRGITLDTILVTTEKVILDNLASAVTTRDESERAVDRAQLLAALVAATTPERAVASAERALDTQQITGMLAVLQGWCLPSVTHADLRRKKFKLKALRSTAATMLGIPEPKALQVIRLSPGSVLMGVLSVAAVSTGISRLSGIGFDGLWTNIRDADTTWLVVALIASQVTNIGEWITLTGLVGWQLPLGPTLQFRYALRFVAMTVPGDAAEIGLTIRYMQKLGVATTAAVTQGPMATITTKVVDLAAIAATAPIVGQRLPLDDIDFTRIVRMIAIVTVVALIAIVTVAIVPSLRVKVFPHAKEALRAIRSVVTDPSRVMRLLGGTVLSRVLFAFTLLATSHALGADVSLVEALLVNSAVSVLIGFIPVPGGVGVGEAALAAGLGAVGVPPETALAIAIVHRLITNYLPPVYGWWASRWLSERDYL